MGLMMYSAVRGVQRVANELRVTGDEEYPHTLTLSNATCTCLRDDWHLSACQFC